MNFNDQTHSGWPSSVTCEVKAQIDKRNRDNRGMSIDVTAHEADFR